MQVNSFDSIESTINQQKAIQLKVCPTILPIRVKFMKSQTKNNRIA